MKKIMNYIYKHPIHIIIYVLVLLAVSSIGISRINIETGNSTLVKDDTDTFIDNDNYQKQFGGETIILQFEPENELFNIEVISLFNNIEKRLKTQSGVFSYQSPATIVKNITSNQYVQFSTGITQIALGLNDLSEMLRTQASQLDGFDADQIDTLSTNIELAINNLKAGQTNLETKLGQVKTGLTSIESTLTQLETDLSNDGQPVYSNQVGQINIQLGQMLTIVTGLETLPGQSNAGLDNMNQQLETFFNQLITQFSQVSSFADQLSVLADNLQSMSNTLSMIVSFSDSFYPDVPKEQATLDQIVNEGANRRPMFNAFVIGEKYLMMQITLSGDISNTEKEEVIYLIEEEIEESTYGDKYLLSGKAVLDLSIQNSMVSSMKSMLALSIGLMLIILLVTFRVKWRILPLITVLLAVIMTIGIMGYLQIPVSMVSMAVFPILIGLGIDYAIQFQNRYSMALEEETSNE